MFHYVSEEAQIRLLNSLDLVRRERELESDRRWARRNRYERLKVAVRGAGLDSSDAADLIALIDREATRLG